MKRIMHFLVVMILAGMLSAQSNKIEFTEFDLDNGLHVILHQDNATPIVVVSVMYHVGSKNENPNRTGFAHFFEHLLFEGSENIGRGEFDKYITNAGGANNAYTSQDKTYYYELLPSNQLELGLWLESERMLHAKVDITGVETQREVVKEERRQRYENQPYGSIILETLKRAYKVHPYQWAPIGSMEHLNAATEEDYINFYNDFYTPNNAVLSIAGDIDIAQTTALVKKYFGSIPIKKQEIYRPNIVEPPLGSQQIDTIYDNIQLPAVVYTYRIPAQGTEDFYAVKMLNTLMSQGQSSRLQKAIVDDQQLAVFVGSFPFELEDPGVALAFGIANMGISPETLQNAMDAEFERAQQELISEEEFQKLRNQIENDFITGNARIAGIAENLANYYLYYGDTDLINTELQRYLQVTKEDIRRVARDYFNKSNRSILHYIAKPMNP